MYVCMNVCIYLFIYLRQELSLNLEPVTAFTGWTLASQGPWPLRCWGPQACTNEPSLSMGNLSSYHHRDTPSDNLLITSPNSVTPYGPSAQHMSLWGPSPFTPTHSYWCFCGAEERVHGSTQGRAWLSLAFSICHFLVCAVVSPLAPMASVCPCLGISSIVVFKDTFR